MDLDEDGLDDDDEGEVVFGGEDDGSSEGGPSGGGRWHAPMTRPAGKGGRRNGRCV
jgi:hypothetical protein